MYKIKKYNHQGKQINSYNIISEFEAHELLFTLIFDEEDGNRYELYEEVYCA